MKRWTSGEKITEEQHFDEEWIDQFLDAVLEAAKMDGVPLPRGGEPPDVRMFLADKDRLRLVLTLRKFIEVKIREKEGV